MKSANAIITIINMKELLLSSDALKLIYKDGLSFRKSIKKVTENEDKLLGVTSSLVGATLRHNLLLNEITKRFENESEDNLYLIDLALVNNFFVKKLDKGATLAFLKDKLSPESYKKLEEMLNFEGPISDLTQIDRSSLDYISLRFNTPKWLVKMWSKHFGRGQAFKILKANTHPAKVFVGLNTLNGEVKLSEEQFEKVDNGLYLYKASSQIKHLDMHKKGQIYVSNLVLEALVNKYLDPLSNEFTFFSGENDHLLKYAHALAKGEKGVNFAVCNLNDRAELLRYLRVHNVKNINLFEYKDEYSLKAGISHKQDFILFEPKSSSFEKIRLYPDYLIHFDHNSLDEIIKNEKTDLVNIASFISDGGILIYEVRTLNKKESSGLIAQFIKEHPSFTLLEERQCFPNEAEDTSMYYAVMKKEEKDD